MARTYVVSYEYLSGADFAWHRRVEIAEDPVEKIKELVDSDFGAYSNSNSPQVRNITWEEAYVCES